MKCPKCHSEISIENINVQTDVGFCDTCNTVFKISDSLPEDVDDGFDMNYPVSGTWIREERHQLIIGASTRSSIAFFLVPFMLVWTGGSLGGIYGFQIVSGEFNLVLSLFGIPFILGSILFWSITLMAIWGKVELKLDQKGGYIYTGMGVVGIRKSFTWDEINTVQNLDVKLKRTYNRSSEIVLEGKKRISFGGSLNESKRYYLYRSLKHILSMAKSNKRFV